MYNKNVSQEVGNKSVTIFSNTFSNKIGVNGRIRGYKKCKK